MNTTRWLTQTSILALACTVGLSIALAMYGIDYGTRMSRIARETNIAKFERSIRIDTYDSARQLLHAHVTDSPTLSDTPIVLRLATSTSLSIQAGVIEDGVVTRIAPAQPATGADLVSGRKALVAFFIRDDGTLSASALSLDNPLIQE